MSVEEAVEKAKKVKLALIDIHGVLTDGAIYYDEDGKKTRAYTYWDRFGCAALTAGGIIVAFLTRESKMGQAIAQQYGVERFYATPAKMAKLDELEQELGFTDENVSYVGDEIIDTGILKRVGFAVATADAVPEAKEVADHITEAIGGKGIVREIAEFILKAQGKWETALEKLASQGF